MNYTSNKYKLLNSIWILSANEQFPYLNCEYISETFKIRRISKIQKILSDFPELFSFIISSRNRKNLVAEILQNRILDCPLSVDEIENENDKVIIRNLFRPNYNSEPVNVERIQWGIEHIKSIKHEVTKRRKNVMQFISTILIPIMAIIISFLSFYLSDIRTSNNLNTIKEQNENGYLEFIELIIDSIYVLENSENLNAKYIYEIDKYYYYFQLKNDEISYKELLEKIQEFKTKYHFLYEKKKLKKQLDRSEIHVLKSYKDKFAVILNNLQNSMK